MPDGLPRSGQDGNARVGYLMKSRPARPAGRTPGGSKSARERQRSVEGLLPEGIVEAAREAVLAAAVQDAGRLLLDRADEVLLGLPDPALPHALDHVAEA